LDDVRLYADFIKAPPSVASVVVNGGSAQRSMVTHVTVTFNTVVTVDADPFRLRRIGGNLKDLALSESVVDGRTVIDLVFTGPRIVGGSLADGKYQLRVRAGGVSADGQNLDGDRDGTPGDDATFRFFRLFGDGDGDRDVDGKDLRHFLLARKGQT